MDAPTLIVPLAGPDFEYPDGSTKAEQKIDGLPLLRRALESRSWWQDFAGSPQNIHFILRDKPISKTFADRCLAAWYPSSVISFLGREADGAALSIAAGAAIATDGPIYIDLADILFDSELSPARLFQESSNLGGIIATFLSDNPKYSYAKIDRTGSVLETAEKRVISEHASAGTYFFRNRAILYRSIAHAIDNPESQAFMGRLFVCPLFNGVIADGWRVEIAQVRNVRDVKVALSAATLTHPAS